VEDLVNLFAKHFIARPDVVAVQHNDGSYSPGKIGFTREVIASHLGGNYTYGHYMLNGNNECKFFCFDVDLKTDGVYWVEPDLQLAPESFTPLELDDWFAANTKGPIAINPRQTWRDRGHEARNYFKRQFRSVAELLTSNIHTQLGIGTLATYSGHKGIHVYGMTGLAPASEVRAAAEFILDAVDFKPTKGKNFYGDSSGEYENLELELFPKQTEVDEGHYGNLLRLELGINRKAPKDPTFFLDQSLPHNTFAPHRNPAWLLENCENPWKEYPNV